MLKMAAVLAPRLLEYVGTSGPVAGLFRLPVAALVLVDQLAPVESVRNLKEREMS